MKRIACVVFVALAGIASAGAADPPSIFLRPSSPVPFWSWTGLYAGVHVGGGAGFTRFNDPAGPSIYGGNVRSPLALGGAQIGYNWQIPNTSFVLGAEGDASALGSDGTNTCFASSGFVISANCRVSQTFAGTIAARLGYAVDSHARTLLYAKGGFAAMHQDVEATTNGILPVRESNVSSTRIGWLAGAGVERALTPAWSLKLEYNYMDFGTDQVVKPATFRQVIPGADAYVAVPAGLSDTRHMTHAVKLGVNLKFNEDSRATWKPSDSEYALKGPIVAHGAGAVVEVGTRAWYSFGRHQKDLGGINLSQNLLVSRLTYDTSAASGEAFGRIDTPDGFFVKGFAGAGRILNGKMHDEDWVIFDATVPYSNTLSQPVKGSLAYATFDVGYAVFRGPNAKVGGFLGYNYSKDSNSAYGCSQIVANPDSVCVPALQDTTLVITQDNQWHALRTGLNGVVTLGNGFSLTAEAAYLPYVQFSGVDNHLLRTDVSDTVSRETATGQGVQLEALLSYSFNPAFSVGAGGRYWAAWVNNSAYVNIFGTECPCQTLPSRSERYGGFVQASYRFDGLK